MTLPELRAAAPYLNLARLSREMGEDSRFLAYVLAGRKRWTPQHERRADEALASAGLAVRRAVQQPPAHPPRGAHPLRR